MGLPIRLVQFNPLVGDIACNVARIEQLLAAQKAPALWVFPELALCGYPPEDLLLRDDFIAQTVSALEQLQQTCTEHWLIIGAPVREQERLYNAACVLHRGIPMQCVYKQLLPHYDVFDEQRYFRPGPTAQPVRAAGHTVGVLICEDLWQPKPAAALAAAGAEWLLCINASPFDGEKAARRQAAADQRTEETGCNLCYVNQVGGQDELVFDGASFVWSATEGCLARLPSFEEGVIELQCESTGWQLSPPPVSECSADEMLYQALVVSVRDYVNKHRAPGGLVGLSGGIDSALTLAIAADALGPERVEAVLMPSRYTAQASLDDARQQCENLKVAHRVYSIEPALTAMLETLEPEVGNEDRVMQNLQSRIRGLLLMALSNATSKLLLTTGNKSELAVGYATLYGDMAGGFAPLKDVFKTRVYDLARFRNHKREVIPPQVLTRAPTAELKENQKDTDTLPDYAQLDEILRLFIEEDQSPAQIIAQGHEESLVRDVIGRVLSSEYKRRQAPPGAKITERAFGRDRRYPITSGYRA